MFRSFYPLEMEKPPGLMMEQKGRKESEDSREGKCLPRDTIVFEPIGSDDKNNSVFGTQEIPKGYNIDTIVVMPVNADMNFVYWEITDKLLNSRLRELNIGSAELIIKISERDSRKEVCSFEIKERIGKNYIKYHALFRPLVAEIGILKNGEFAGLLKSRTVPPPSPEIAGTGEEIWMEKIKGLGGTVWVSGSEDTHDMASPPSKTIMKRPEQGMGFLLPVKH